MCNLKQNKKKSISIRTQSITMQNVNFHHILCILRKRNQNRFSLCKNRPPNIEPIRPFSMRDMMDRSANGLVAACCRPYHRAARGRHYVYLNSFALYLATIHLCLIVVAVWSVGGAGRCVRHYVCGVALCHFKSAVGAVCIAENWFAFVFVTFQ